MQGHPYHLQLVVAIIAFIFTSCLFFFSVLITIIIFTNYYYFFTSFTKAITINFMFVIKG